MSQLKDKDKDYQNHLHEARGILDDARLVLANYVVGYMGVGFGLTIQKSN